MGTIYSQRKNRVQPGKRRGRHFQLCRIADLPRNGERCEYGGRWEDVKVALPGVRGLHGSRTARTRAKKAPLADSTSATLNQNLLVAAHCDPTHESCLVS